MAAAVQIASFDRMMVLFPQGQPTTIDHRLRCAELIVKCGGDVTRFIDSPSTSIDRFITYIGRIRHLHDGTEPAIVVLTRTNPLGLAVVNARRMMEAALPSLRWACWLLYVNPTEDPFFEDSSTRLGELLGKLPEAPIWVGPDDKRFLVLSPLVGPTVDLTDQIAGADLHPVSRSRVRLVAVDESSNKR